MTFASSYTTILKSPMELEALMLQSRIDTTLRYYAEIDILETGKN